MQVHAEHGDAIVLAQQAVFAAGITGPEGHAVSRPAVLEVRRRPPACCPPPLDMMIKHRAFRRLSRSSYSSNTERPLPRCSFIASRAACASSCPEISGVALARLCFT